MVVFLPQARPMMPGNADLSPNINALGQSIAGAVGDIRNRNQLTELGAAARGGNINALRDTAFGQGRIGLGLQADQTLQAREAEAANRSLRERQMSQSQANADRAFKLDADKLLFARSEAERDFELKKWVAETGFETEMAKIEASRAKLGNILSPGEEATDKAFAKEFVEWNATGGFADVDKQIEQLERVSESLGTGDNLTGPMIGNTPDRIASMFPAGQRAISAREAVQEVAQRNLRVILGAQFTEKEGDQLIRRVYNPTLPEAENKRRVDALIRQIRTAAQQKQAASEYFQTNGTLKGFQGRLPRLSDFGPNAGKAPGKGDGRPIDVSQMSDDELLNALGLAGPQ